MGDLRHDIIPFLINRHYIENSLKAEAFLAQQIGRKKERTLVAVVGGRVT
jgi:hypothetical protein